jgi:hypothetical protein
MVPYEGGAYPGTDDVTIGSGLTAPVRVQAAGTGDVYIADAGGNQIVGVMRSQASFSFAPQAVGTPSTPQLGSMWNIGNATLTFQMPMTSNSGDSDSFQTSTGPGIGNTHGCDLTGGSPIAFGYGSTALTTSQPTKSGALSATITLLSNAVNLNPVTVQESGTGIGNSIINLYLSQDGSKPIPYGTNLSLIMSVSQIGSLVPTGNFTYQIDNGMGQTVALVSGAYTLQLGSGLSVGSHVVSVTYSGDANYLAQTNPQIQLT